MNRIVPISAAGTGRAVAAEGYTAPAPARYTGPVDDVIARLLPVNPLYVIWPDRLAAAARHFTAVFPGEVMYAMKANPDRSVIRTLYNSGVRSFDAASIEEVRQVRGIAPKAKICFMHPVKSPEAIREAYYKHGVRVFVLDCLEELYKIMRETDLASDLTLFVRLALPKNGAAAIDFSMKFGALPDEAATLLQSCRTVASQLGLCFHVGTQTTDAAVYGRAISVAAQVMRDAAVTVDMLDVGGGFPVPYPGEEDVPHLSACIEQICSALEREGLSDIPLLCEPGRAMVAQAGALVVRVEQRRRDVLYINDGTYGGLFDAGTLLKTRYPVRAVRPDGEFTAAEQAYSFAGPTCDSLDMMPGPFILPEDMGCGDWIVLGNMGAYSASIRTNFNGFGKAGTVYLYDAPASMARI